jgi:ADP-ribose pyrophosphatase YjhB (NUDIX family)
MPILSRQTRYQAAIMRGSEILLIRQLEYKDGRTYWLLPGGGREGNESEEDCVRREMREETDLEVQIERLLLTYRSTWPNAIYKDYKTYLCSPGSGEARPGYEPEIEASAVYGIVEVRWVDLWDETGWDDRMRSDPITYANLERIRKALGGLP